jgi:hypothetical protein
MRLTLKRLLGVLLVWTGAVALFYSEESLRGRWAWERHLRGLAAKGVSLDIKALIPPPVPDAENVAAAPIFAELFATNRPGKARLTAMKIPAGKRMGNEGWRAGLHQDLSVWREAFTNDNLLAAMERYAPELKEVELALQRPKVRFPVEYEKGYDALIPQGNALLNIAKVCNARALAELEAGQMINVYRDVKIMCRLSGLIKDEPFSILMLVHVALCHFPLQALWEGLSVHAWTDEQLAELQHTLEQVDMLAQLERVWCGERGLNEWVLRSWLNDPRKILELGSSKPPPETWSWVSLWPRGWFYQNALRVDERYDEQILPVVNSHVARVYPLVADAANDQMENIPSGLFTLLSRVLLPEVKDLSCKVAASQTYLSEAAVACALERYWLQRRRYPDTLAELVPQFLVAVPHDVVDGQPLRYRLDGAGGFVLYSIGWDLLDDGGTMAWKTPGAPSERPKLDLEKGDWVWRSRPATDQVHSVR